MSEQVLRVGGGFSIRWRRRSLVTGLLLAAGLVVIAVVTLTAGKLGIAPGGLWAVLTGDGTGTDRIVFGVIRGPRLFVAILAGAAFGVAGTLFQTVTRNPLGSPDVIGLTAGASAGAAAFGLLWPGILPLPAGALAGALAAMALIWAGTGRGFSSPSRMLLIGIGVSAMSLAFVQYVLARVSREQSTVLAAYLNGSLASRSWTDVLLVAGALVVLLPGALAVSRRLQLVEMGDEQADALGARTDSARFASILLAIGLSAAAVTVAGPVAFISLTAPQIAKRLCRAAGPAVLLSALMGAVLLALADLVTQNLPIGLPVGILTGALGGLYLGYLLITEWKKGTV